MASLAASGAESGVQAVRGCGEPSLPTLPLQPSGAGAGPRAGLQRVWQRAPTRLSLPSPAEEASSRRRLHPRLSQPGSGHPAAPWRQGGGRLRAPSPDTPLISPLSCPDAFFPLSYPSQPIGLLSPALNHPFPRRAEQHPSQTQFQGLVHGTRQENPFALSLYATLTSPRPFQQPGESMAKAAWLQSQGTGSRTWTPMRSITSSLLGCGRPPSGAGEGKPGFGNFCKPKEPRGLI